MSKEQTSKLPDLALCPFCRHNPLGVSTDKDPIIPMRRIACGCGAIGPIADTPEEAAALWNAWTIGIPGEVTGMDRGIDTPWDLMRSLHAVCMAAKKIRLPEMPESPTAMNARHMVEELHATLTLNQMETAHGTLDGSGL